MTEAREARLYHVFGGVQAVGYRYFVQQVAVRLGLAGYVKNLRDGPVEVYAIGTSALLVEFRLELERGPRAADVREVMEEGAGVEERFADGFSIEHETW